MMEPIDPAMSTTKRSRRRPNLTLALPKRNPSFSSSPPPSSSPTITTTKTHQTFSLTLNDLHKERRIGSGVVGTVYKVRHRPTNKSYALKVISGNHEESVRRTICREIEILLAVDHPNVVKCYGLFETAGEIHVLLEYMDCGSLLGAHIHHEPSLALLSLQILSGLAYLHNRKIVHRDIKPANLLINSRRQVKIADFGVSRILAETMGATNSLVGTVEYISPERINRDLNYGVYDGYAGDIWSFGVTVLEVYLGRFPFVVEKDGDWASLISAICFSAPPEVPETGSREFRHFIGCCLQIDPAKRWTAEQLLQDPFITRISLRYQANAQQDPTSWGTYVKSKLLQNPVSSSTPSPNPELPISPEQSVRTTKPPSPKNIAISMTKAKDGATNQKDATPNEEPTSSKDVMSGIAVTDIFDRLPSHLKECLLYTSLFPRNYRFEKDTLIHLWTAAGYVQQEDEELIEDTCGDYFDKLLSMNLFQESFPLNYPTRPRFYKLQDDAHDLVQNCSPGEYARLDDDNIDDISGQARHLAVLGEKVDQLDFGSFNRMGELHSLLLLHEKKKCITQIPYDLFLNLRCLCVLDLSRTQLTELPSSVGSLGALRYLDLSGTCIKWLPPSVTALSNLQVLRLRDCYNFVELPKDTMDMINLRHLDLDVIRQLRFMPQKMGKLTNLQTLNAFIVGTDYGCQIEELKDLVNLRGSLILIKLEHVLTSMDAKEAMLSNKKYLRRLVMQWSSSCPAEEVLEALEPHIDLEELEVVCYGGLVFSPWLGDPSFSKLSGIYLYNCKHCFLLPPLGRLPSLKLLKVGEMHAVKEIDYRFCGGGGKGFPRLETLHFDGMPCLEKWTGVEEGEMPWLEELKIVDCPELVQLPNLSHLKSLQHLEISYCSKLTLLTEEDLSVSMQRLVISGCPILEERCCKGGDDWQKISNITTIQIDYQHISKN